ncbi:hypothetical protein LWI28_000494 [Acer negundo]|uniref:Transposase MuDR plant domain-containing protein n=1 Tax=Acer negundo TaxID=4023 RepID=A0AAD5JNS1_ACENE|nr:hypothetical protein LWI28_000494 [Acer negundo]
MGDETKIVPDSHYSNSECDSDDEQLSNAASFHRDPDDMANLVSDEGSPSRLAFTKRGRPFKLGGNGNMHLEVVQLFNHLYHFRQVLRDYAVQEGFQLKRLKNEKEKHTSECAYEGCTWRIHASPIEDQTTFQIKIMHDRHSC